MLYVCRALTREGVWFVRDSASGRFFHGNCVRRPARTSPSLEYTADLLVTIQCTRAMRLTIRSSLSG